MTILVTGAAGFIGFHVSRSLMARGDSVLGIDSINDYYDPNLKQRRIAELNRLNSGNFLFERVDFSDHVALEAALAPHDFDHIIHLGAQAGVRYSIDNPRAYIQSNLVGHLNLLEVARHRKTANFVYASSSSVYGNNKTLPFRVDDRVDQPVSLYAATKKSDELISETYAHLYRLPQTGLRFFTVYGPWGRPDMAMWIFTRKILASEPIQVFNYGNMRRDFTYIDDIVTGILACLDTPSRDDGSLKPGGSVSPHRIYNIGNNRPEDLMHMIALLEETCGRKAILEMLPMQPGDVPETFADIEALSRDLDFSPTTSIEEGIPRFVEWYRSYTAG
ncbi:NAD-dependent epimerase/dehydratase family protein [Sphingosinicella sp. LHD-64]|uniref:NAD-dependent epimerase/dehydratase family protein n=1 Tax=Sphingosinicella sp. LHD-64 TaxID=3072139 RepID=UPI00280FA566|nr:NAD-dependent epimerase/dehydratase family protein [Sphingosinicella sp. LHD-64]MDQ8757215.1 NAD-dependent epimerase/dehydratase family protein [Sphingosinicella sp. LHD-64]